MDQLAALLGRNGFLPHGYCFSWSPTLLWSMVGADAVIALAYFSIPVAILTFVRRRGAAESLQFGYVPWLFSAFIFACGMTHVIDVWTIWQPDYGLQALSKVVTAGVSAVTAVALWPLIPRALKVPSVGALQAAIRALESEVARRKSVEEQAQHTEQTLAVTLASIEAGFITTNRDGQVLRMNAVAEQVTGWTQAEAQGQSLWTVFNREGRPLEMQQRNPVDLVVEQGLGANDVHDVAVLARDSTRRLVEVRVATTHGNDGELRGLTMVFRDMTRLERAETAMHRLAAIVENSQDAIVGKTLDGHITSWNQGAVAMFGWTAAEAIGQPVQMLMPPERQMEEMRILTELARGQQVGAFDTVRQAKDGRRIDVSVTISPIRDTSGRIVGASKIARDVSRQRHAEAALRDSEAQLRLALEAGQIGNFDHDARTGEVRRSARHDLCFGYDQLQPHWSFRSFLRHVHPMDRAGVLAGVRTMIADGHAWHAECRVVWPDASPHWIRIHGRPVFLNGQLTRVLGVVSDVTPERLAEAARLKAQRLEAENRDIQAASRMKSQFLANMSHELRTPLNAVIGFAELLRAGAVPPGSPKHDIFLGHIASSGHHLLQLINDVLDLAKVESGKFEFNPEPVDLAKLVADVVGVLQTGLQRKNLQLAVDMAPDLDDLCLDPARLKQALFNYLSNAIKFTPDGGHVKVRARPDGPSHFRIEVEDDGVGIVAEDQARLFVEFQQLDSGYSKRHQGTGLGLALTRRLVQGQGGSVGVYSEPGVGSVFYLVLPRSPQVLVLTADEYADTAPGQEGERHLLVIDADPTVHGRLAQGLSGTAMQVEEAGSAAAAVQRSFHHRFEGLTLGMQLPDRGGLTTLADIRSGGASRGAQVLGLTMGVPLDAGGSRTAAFCVADVLAKPLQAGEVLAAIHRLRQQCGAVQRVLVVDDDPTARDLMQAALQAAGLTVVCVADARQALRDIDQHAPDAIVLDLMMPEMDGFQALAALSALPRWCHTPVLVWTSLLLDDDEYAQLARSARAIVGKGEGGVQAMLERLRDWKPALQHKPLFTLAQGAAP